METTLPPPEGLDELAPGLLSTEQLGVPDTWALLDFDPQIIDDPEIVGDVDPFRGLVTCPVDLVRDAANPWIARKASAIDEPLDNGLLTVELILELESTDAYTAGVERLTACAAGDGSTLSTSKSSLELTGTSPIVLPAAGFQLVSTGTDEVPFAYAIEALWAHDGAFTVGVVLSGQPADATSPVARPDWRAAAERIAALALGQLLAANS